MRKNLGMMLLIASLGLWFSGCASPAQRLSRMSVGMTKHEVRGLFGNIFTARAGKVDKEGNVLDLWEYKDAKTKNTYVIYFLNNRVSQWGKQDDLKEFPELYLPQADK